MSAAELQVQLDAMLKEKNDLIEAARAEKVRRDKEATVQAAALLAPQTQATYAHLQSKRNKDNPEYLDRIREDKLPLVQTKPMLPEFCGAFTGAAANVAVDVLEYVFRTHELPPLPMLSADACGNLEVSMSRTLLEGTSKSRTADRAILTAMQKKTSFMPLSTFISAWSTMVNLVRLISDDGMLPARFEKLLRNHLDRLSVRSEPVLLHSLATTYMEVSKNITAGRPYGSFQDWSAKKMSIYETQYKQHALTVNQNASDATRTVWGVVLLTAVDDKMIFDKLDLDRAICSGEILHGVTTTAMRITNAQLPTASCIPLLIYAPLPSHVGGVATGGGGGSGSGGQKKVTQTPAAGQAPAAARVPAQGLFCPVCAQVPAVPQ
ncbi:hypothetical protein P7C70_g7413, partial [Phenoliferia sp. Uapishka_3]